MVKLDPLLDLPLHFHHNEQRWDLLSLLIRLATPKIRTPTRRPICLRSWVEFTLIWVLHHPPHLPSRFCQIPISPGRIGQTVEHTKFSQPNSVHEQMVTPCTCMSPSVLWPPLSWRLWPWPRTPRRPRSRPARTRSSCRRSLHLSSAFSVGVLVLIEADSVSW